MNIDKAFESLESLEKDYFNDLRNKDLTEADTRSKLLDYILINILGWSEQDIEREGYVKPGFFDYEIRTSTFKFLIEAKKNLVDFDMPSKGTNVKIKTIYKSNKEVIDQIRTYLFERGLQYGIISNGHQFIVAKFLNHDGTPWGDNIAYYFNGFEDIRKRFTKFYELFSKEYITFFGRIKIDRIESKSKRIINDVKLPHLHDELNRNKLSSELIPVLTRVFEEIYKTSILSDKEIMKKCYVGNEDVQKYSDELNAIFLDIPPSFDEKIAKVRNTKHTQEQIKKDIYIEGYNPDPIVVIGTAGAGKTTFIKNFIDIELNPKEKKKRPIVYIDFREFSAQEVYDTKLIYEKIILGIKKEHPGLNIHKRNILKTIYKKEISENKEGIWEELQNDKVAYENKLSEFLEEKTKNPLLHLEYISNYLNFQCQKKLCVVFDNADQLKDTEQREIFLLAHSINRKLNCIVISSLREGYYYRWKDKAPFNAYHSTVYHITAPPYRKVLKKRIEYVLENFDFKEISIQFDDKKVGFEKGSLKVLFKNLYKTLFETNNSEILRFLEETSYPNIRHGLEMFQTFLLSGHSKITEYMSVDYVEGIPYWEFIKSVALESAYYYTAKSKIYNLFQPIASNQNHFTKIRLLNYLLIENQKDGKGLKYVVLKDIQSIFIQIGYSSDIIKDELNDLLNHNLISTSDYLSDIDEVIELKEDSRIAISPIGNYYIDELIYNYSYLDLTVQNTSFYDNKFFQKIISGFPVSDKYGNRDLTKRLNTAKLFLDYLKSQELHDLSRQKLENENGALSLHITQKIEDRFSKEFKRIKKIIKK